MADAQILLGNSLRPSTLAINLLLDNVKHTQILQEKVSLFCVYFFIVQKLFNNDMNVMYIYIFMYFQSEAREWITTSNKLLNSRKDRQV